MKKKQRKTFFFYSSLPTKKTQIFVFSRSLSTNSPRQLNILGHDGHSASMNNKQVSVLRKKI